MPQVHVVAAGTFDGLHGGHRFYLRAAKLLGDVLTVIVARDATIPLVKGKRTRQGERSRLAVIAALPEVDRAILGDPVRSGRAKERFRILLRLRPDIVCLGYDQPVKGHILRAFLDEHGMHGTKIVRVGKAPGE